MQDLNESLDKEGGTGFFHVCSHSVFCVSLERTSI